MKYKVVSESAQETPIDNQDNPFISYTSTDINETKRKANKLGSAYFLNFGGGYSKISTLDAPQNGSSLKHKGHMHGSSKYRVQRGPPKMLKRILKHLGKRKQVLTSFWMEHTVEKWKHTLLYLVFKAWVYVVQVKSKEEGRFIEMIKNMRGHTTKQWFERWVLFYQEQQKKKIKKNKEQAAIEQKLNLKMLELKSAEATSINNTLGQDIKYLKSDVENLTSDLESSNFENVQLRRTNAEISEKLEALNNMVSSEESSTPILLQGCKSSVISFVTNIEPQLQGKLRTVSIILSYLLKKWKKPAVSAWSNPLLLTPYLLQDNQIDEILLHNNNNNNNNSLTNMSKLETAMKKINCRAISMSWMEYHYHQQERKEFIKKKKRPIVMPDDVIDGYVWSVIIDSIIEDEMVETRGIKRKVWKMKRQRERVNVLISNFKKLGIYSATTLNSYVKFRDGTPSEHYAILAEVMRKYPGIKTNETDATSLMEDCTIARKSLKQIILLKEDLESAIANANALDFTNITNKAQVDSVYESLYCRIGPFEKQLKNEVQKVEEIEQSALKLLFSWPRWTNMWKSIVLDCSIYSKRALKYAEEAATNKTMEAKESKDGNNDGLSQIGNQKESDNILSPYSKISLQWLKALSPSLSFTEDDFIEIKNIIRLLSPSIHKMFQIYTGHLRDNLKNEKKTKSEQAASAEEETISYIQWWWMTRDFGLAKRFQGRLIEDIYSKSIIGDVDGSKTNMQNETVSIFSSCTKAQFTLSLIRMCSIIYTDQHPCDSLTHFVETYVEDIESNNVKNNSDIRQFSSQETVLNTIEEFELEIITFYQKYASVDVGKGIYAMDIEELIFFLKTLRFLNYRVHEKKIRQIFRELTGSISDCTQPMNEAITYIQFLLLLIVVFLIDEPNPFEERHVSFKKWIISKFKIEVKANANM